MNIAVIYTHYPHYRQAVFSQLLDDEDIDFEIYYDVHGIDSSIKSSKSMEMNFHAPVVKISRFMWQNRALRLALSSKYDGIIYLGNPYIISTWVSAILAKLAGKKVLYWTHGWIKQDPSLIGKFRNLFYRLADKILVYGYRSKEIGISEKFDATKINVIGNSLDYTVQKKCRDEYLKSGEEFNSFRQVKLSKPYFVVVSRLVKQIQIELVLQALSKISKPCSLVIVGDGPEKNGLKKMAEELSVDTVFLGPIYEERQLCELFMNSQATVSPGKVGLLAIHSLSYGTPVITHDDLDRQMPEAEAVQDGVTGSLFNYGSLDHLVETMEAYRNIPLGSGERKKIYDAAIKTIESDYTSSIQLQRIKQAVLEWDY